MYCTNSDKFQQQKNQTVPQFRLQVENIENKMLGKKIPRIDVWSKIGALIIE